MRLANATLVNFRCCEHFAVALSPGFNVFIGPNGFGKTTILDGIASGLAGLYDVVGAYLGQTIRHPDVRRTFHGGHPRPIYGSAVTLEATLMGQSVRWTLELNSNTSSHNRRTGDMTEVKRLFSDMTSRQANGESVSLPLIAAYRVDRFSRPKREPSTDPLNVGLPQVEDENVKRALAESRRDMDTVASVYDNALLSGALWEPVRTMWSKVLIESSNDGARGRKLSQACVKTLQRAMGDPDAPEPRYMPDEWDVVVSLPEIGPRPVGLMSDGWRGYVSLVADLTLKAAQLNPHLEDPGLESEGVVLIDELDLHLHPGLQRTAIARLRDTFPKMQFLVTTHSPLVIGGALTPTGVELEDGVRTAKDRIYRLDSVEDGTPVAIEVPRPIGLRADQTLTGDWYGLPSTLDDDTLSLLRLHRGMLREHKSPEERRELESTLRARLGRFADTSLEQLVLSVVAHLEADDDISEMSLDERRNLRESVIGLIRDHATKTRS